MAVHDKDRVISSTGYFSIPARFGYNYPSDAVAKGGSPTPVPMLFYCMRKYAKMMRLFISI